AYDGTHVVGTTAIVASGASTFAIGSSTAGSVAGDYSFTAPTIANAAASITAKALNATAAIGGTPSKIYDGTNVATGATVAGSVTGAIAGDTLALDTRGVTLAYDGTHVVGTNAIVASGSAGLVIGASAVGSVASDYAFTPPAIADAQAAITPRAISVIAPAASKVVDGNTRASGTVSIGGAGLVAGELVTDATLTYDSPVPGTGKTVTPSAAVFGGSAVASDYAVAYVGNDAGAILPAEAVRLPTTLPTLPFRSSPALAPRIVSGPDAVAAADGGGGVRVTLVAPPTASAAGQVTVDASSTSFTFVLPGDLPAPTRVTLADGRALPGWLRFDAGSGRFAVDSAPADGLPLQVVATVRNERYVVTVRKTQR
ncbi:MAG: YDG domain-containing protein, partial [Betaproteobacteria bacterium]